MLLLSVSVRDVFLFVHESCLTLKFLKTCLTLHTISCIYLQCPFFIVNIAPGVDVSFRPIQVSNEYTAVNLNTDVMLNSSSVGLLCIA